MCITIWEVHARVESFKTSRNLHRLRRDSRFLGISSDLDLNKHKVHNRCNAFCFRLRDGLNKNINKFSGIFHGGRTPPPSPVENY